MRRSQAGVSLFVVAVALLVVVVAILATTALFRRGRSAEGSTQAVKMLSVLPAPLA